jgi:hypothetical protein
MEEEDYEDYDGYEDYEDMANVPGLKKKDDVFSLFKRVWRAPDSSKIANLSIQELGMLPMSVRDNQYLALLGTTFNHDDLAAFFMGRSEITLATSMAKKGWFTELFVSQKKFTQKSSSQTMNLPENNKPKWSLYNKSKQQQMPQV